MSVIQTIRNKYGKIAGGVIAVALIGFIISDARNGSLANFFGGKDSNVMKINGTKIDPKEYNAVLKEFEILYSMFNKNQPLDEATRAQMNEQVVQMVAYQTLVNEQCDKLGIITSEEEKKELIYGENADPIVRQFQMGGQQIFINQQTNQFDPQIIKYMEKQLAEDPQKVDPNGKMGEQWAAVKSYVLRMSRINKFNSLFGDAVYIPAYAVKRTISDQNSMASIRYVKVPFTTVSDNDAKITDDDIKAYMQKHKAMFETDQPTRTIEYVSFDIIPSSADTASKVQALNEMKADFAATKDNKTFVNNKSEETNSFTEVYFNKRTYMSRYADTLLSMPVGEVFGPYYENGGYRLTKIVDRKTLPDSVKCRHILVKIKDRGNEVRSDSAAKQKLDSAIAEINAGANFDSVVAKYSEDDGSNKKGGEYTFTLQQRPTISKEFADFIFDGAPGDKKTVKVSNDNYWGYHYIQILEHKGVAPSTQLATITKNLVPSDSTNNAIFGKANEFAGKNPTGAEFDAAVKKQNLDKRIGDHIKVTSFTISGLGGNGREIIRWAYDHKVGEVSGVFQMGDQRYVVAKLASINEKGQVGITAANRPMLEQRVRDEKKAEAIMNKYKGAASLDAIAAGSGQTVMQADTVTLGQGPIAGLGFEPKVAGYAFNSSFQPNTVSPGIKGQGGVYFITVLNRNVAQIDPKIMDMLLPQQRNSQLGQMRNTVNQALQQDLIRKADIKYNANNF